MLNTTLYSALSLGLLLGQRLPVLAHSNHSQIMGSSYYNLSFLRVCNGCGQSIPLLSLNAHEIAGLKLRDSPAI